MKLADAFVNFFQPNAIRVEHRATPPRRKSVSIDVDHVDISRSQRESFAKRARAFVDQRKDETLDYFVCGKRSTLNSRLRRRSLDNGEHFGIYDRFSAVVVFVPALASLLSETPERVQFLGSQRP